MREILFRGKTKHGEWVKGSYVYAHKWFGTGESGHFITSIYGDNRVLVIPETVGQYTGLKDKFGTKIFEGDIVKEDDCFHNGELQIKGNAWRVAFAEGLFFGNYEDISVYLQSLDGMEVIGNIHDNPELLEE